MKDEYLTKRLIEDGLAEKILRHYKRLPTLHILARHPFVCWIVSAMFVSRFRYEDYGIHPPRLTPFLIDMMIIQMNRRLEFYYGHPRHNFVMFSDSWIFIFLCAFASFTNCCSDNQLTFSDRSCNVLLSLRNGRVTTVTCCWGWGRWPLR